MHYRCPTCSHNTSAEQTPDKAYRVRCAACGEYTISFEAVDAAAARVNRLAPSTREASDAGRPLVITAANVGELLRRYEAVPLGGKTRKLLQLVAARAPEPGTVVDVNAFYDFALVGAASPAEMMYLLQHAAGHGFLAIDGYTDPSHVNWSMLTVLRFVLTPMGWDTLSPIAGGLPGTCFVAMWFDRSVQQAYLDGIKPALEADCGYTVLQMSEHEHNNSITDEMLVQIRNAEFVVADVTGQRPNVYFEAGFALALGRPVIWSCREDEATAIHFDTRQFSHLLWQTPADLRRLLAARVKATIRPQASR